MSFIQLPKRVATTRLLVRTFLVSSLFAGVTSAQSVPATPAIAPQPLSLDEAVRTAESQSETIRIARAGVRRAEGQQYQARSQRLPQLSGSASYVRTLASQFSSVGGSAPLSTRPSLRRPLDHATSTSVMRPRQ